MGKAKVRRRVKALQAEFVEQSMWARNLSIEALKEVIEAPDRKSDVVAAVRELNAMHGFHEAQKIEHSGSIASIERRIVDVGTIDASAVDAAPNKKDPR
jgi:mannose-6-phosphate isomerase class I